MKKLLIILAIAVTSCTTQRELSTYNMSGWLVCKDTTVIARVTSTEIELTPRGKVIQEISLTAESHATITEAEEVLRYVGNQFPNAKIELNLDGIQNYNTTPKRQ
jgi:hypothetical protein